MLVTFINNILIYLKIIRFFLKMATNFGLKFYETSAKENINIQKIFCDMAKDLTERVAIFLIL